MIVIPFLNKEKHGHYDIKSSQTLSAMKNTAKTQFTLKNEETHKLAHSHRLHSSLELRAKRSKMEIAALSCEQTICVFMRSGIYFTRTKLICFKTCKNL